IVPGAWKQSLDQQCLAEGRRRLGDGYRRHEVKGSLGRGEYSVKAVAEFVSHRQHITDAAAVVQQHVWMHAARPVTEGARELRRSWWRVDPALIEETCDDRAHPRRQRAVTVEHKLSRLDIGVAAFEVSDRCQHVVI